MGGRTRARANAAATIARRAAPPRDAHALRRIGRIFALALASPSTVTTMASEYGAAEAAVEALLALLLRASAYAVTTIPFPTAIVTVPSMGLNVWLKDEPYGYAEAASVTSSSATLSTSPSPPYEEEAEIRIVSTFLSITTLPATWPLPIGMVFRYVGMPSLFLPGSGRSVVQVTGDGSGDEDTRRWRSDNISLYNCKKSRSVEKKNKRMTGK